MARSPGQGVQETQARRIELKSKHYTTYKNKNKKEHTHTHSHSTAQLAS